MALKTDAETLKIPAFMRKKTLGVSQKKQMLIMTALDRKNAGISIIKKPQKTFVAPRLPKKQKREQAIAIKTFAAPFIAAPKSKLKSIGEITHYYDKINVAVIKLSAGIAVGDRISYQTANNENKQTINSMQIDRRDVGRAGRGKEIGIKLNARPRIGSPVTKIS